MSTCNLQFHRSSFSKRVISKFSQQVHKLFSVGIYFYILLNNKSEVIWLDLSKMIEQAPESFYE